MRYHALIKLTRRGVAALAATLVCAVALSAAAHDIPTDVKINAFVKPECKRLELLIRVPLAAMSPPGPNSWPLNIPAAWSVPRALRLFYSARCTLPSSVTRLLHTAG